MNLNDLLETMDPINQPEHRAFLRVVQAAMLGAAEHLEYVSRTFCQCPVCDKNAANLRRLAGSVEKRE